MNPWKFFRRYFSPPNSLVLTFDHLGHDAMEDFDARIAEVGKYYRFVGLPALVHSIKLREPFGMASVVFLNARKSTLLRALPRLRNLGIPSTIFLRVDCVGSNRLPPEEELAIFQAHYGTRIPAEEAARQLDSAWDRPEILDDYLVGLRKRVGPFPVEPLDPTRFFSTWGKVLEVASDDVTLGVTITADPRQTPLLSEWIAFIRQRSGISVRFAYCPRPVNPAASWIYDFGLEAIVTNCDGRIDRSTEVFNLPRWTG